MRERNVHEKPQFSGLSRLMASLCDSYLSVVSVTIRHHALLYKDDWSHHQIVHNSTSLFRLAIANYKADPETPTCTTDVDPNWTKVFHPEQNHCDFAPQSVVKPWLIPWCPTARSTSSLSSLSSSGFLWRCLSCYMLSLRGDHGFEEKKSLRA